MNVRSRGLALPATLVFLLVPNLALAQVLSPRAAQRMNAPAPTLEQTVASLQQQVQALSAQVAALQSVLKVTSTGATLQAPTLSLLSINGTEIRSSKAVSIEAGTSISSSGATTVSIRAGGSASLNSSGTLDLKGSTIKLNGGTKPIAIVGSAVGNGQVLNGSSTIAGD